jgi:putative ABC transport system permease protein
MRDWMERNNDNVDVFLPAATAADLYFRVPNNRAAGVNSAVVRVDSEDNVKEVDRQISALGLDSYSPIKILEQVRFNVMMISLTTSFVALVALLVAGLGIANTLLMSVLERTHEIGIMKAVGARERHIQMLFLVEGALIGLMGSGVGLLSAWLASYPLDRLARRLAEQQAQTPLTQSLFIFPWWLAVGVPVFVTLLTMMAAAYPAWRAARVNPMTALRHE